MADRINTAPDGLDGSSVAVEHWPGEILAMAEEAISMNASLGKSQEDTMKSGYIYFIHAKGHDLYKIGMTAGSPQKRLEGLSVGCPHELELTGIIETINPRYSEKIIHSKLEAFRTRGEWFEVKQEMIMGIIEESGGILDIALENKEFATIDGVLVLQCELSPDGMTLITERCPFCGEKHTHGSGGGKGHRQPHCQEPAREKILLPNGSIVEQCHGYYLEI